MAVTIALYNYWMVANKKGFYIIIFMLIYFENSGTNIGIIKLHIQWKYKFKAEIVHDLILYFISIQFSAPEWGLLPPAVDSSIAVEDTS